MVYRLTERVDLEEIGCVMTQLVHEECGARILHLGNNDPENLFCLSFQTLPFRSDGAPHILEHTVLCGSQKYPVKDPFFAMTRRSLNTFMNAMTGDDLTFYPAASQISKDFYNLLDVYIDAVFFPQLSRLSFLQEGHRLEFVNSQNPSSGLTRKGVVYNEMKGAMASADSRSWQRLVQELYPNTPYRFNSGGDPQIIPQLTHEELIQFHQTYYHPSRCLFFFYGNLPLEHHLEYLHSRLLRQSNRLPPLPPVPTQPRFAKPVVVADTFPIAPGEDPAGKGMVLFGYLTTLITDPDEVLALCVLDLLLTGTDASPLKLALLKSGLCKDAYSFLSADMADVPFVIVCKGTKATDADRLKELIDRELLRLEQEGFPTDQIEAAIHQFEFSRTEIKGDSAPYGLSLFRRSGPLVHFGIDPQVGLRVHTLFRTLRERLMDAGALGRLIRHHFLNNTHQCQLIMNPDPEQMTREESEERQVLDRIHASLASQDQDRILKETAELERYQEETEEQALEALPKISLKDVPKHTQDYSLQEGRDGALVRFHHDCFTNEIIYAGLHFDLPHVEDEELPFVELLTSMLTEVGAGGRSYTEQLDYLMAHTGGFAAGVSLNAQSLNHHRFKPAISLTGKALEHKADRFFPLFLDLLTSADFSNTQRLRELVIQYDSAIENALATQGLRYASSLATAALSPSARVADAWKGVRFLGVIRKLARDLDTQIPFLQTQLCSLQSRILAAGQGHLVLSYASSQLQKHLEQGFYGLQSLQSTQAASWQVPLETTLKQSQGRIIPSPVAFTCQAMTTIPYSHPDAPILSVITRLFDHTTLHPLVREQGGAYGAGSSYSPSQSLLYFYSYRDPNLSSTLAAFNQALSNVAETKFNERELEEAKLSWIQKSDSPISPGSRGGVAYGWWREGKTREMRQAFRDRLLQTTRQDCARVVREHLLPNWSASITVSCAGKDLLERENRRLADPLPLSPL